MYTAGKHALSVENLEDSLRLLDSVDKTNSNQLDQPVPTPLFVYQKY